MSYRVKVGTYLEVILMIRFVGEKMKKILIIICALMSVSGFSSEGKMQEFISCKKEVKKLRRSYAYNETYAFAQNSPFDLSIYQRHTLTEWFYKPLRDLEYARMLMSYRPWLKEKSLDKKISSCQKLRSEFLNTLGEPRGVDSDLRDHEENHQMILAPNEITFLSSAR